MKTRTVITIPIPVPDKAFNALCDYMDGVRCKRDIAFVAGDAILAYIANGRARAAEAPGKAPQGFQWKDVFLPDGTRLKTRVRRRTYYAAVQGDRIQCEGKEMSPHVFANAFGVEGRNAWRHVWVHLPYDTSWKIASSLRQRNGW
ncbi:hypothetical protein [Pseudoduganella sp. GCM10020061]|uniref:hypothetical protein n=1 Tax=Pseudoduganella sp. GCM10020061 TaxID=3317345 RepID=UPI0036396397